VLDELGQRGRSADGLAALISELASRSSLSVEAWLVEVEAERPSVAEMD
jgi:hypothetical protein